MNDSLSDALKEAMVCAPSDDVYLETLEIRHASIAEPIYLVRNREDITATLETSDVVVFEAAAFRMALPASGDNGLQELTLAVDNVDRRVSDFFSNAKNYQTPVQCTYRPYLLSDLSEPQMNPPLVLYLSDISITLFEVTAKASFVDLLNKKFPSELYTRARFPSLGG